MTRQPLTTRARVLIALAGALPLTACIDIDPGVFDAGGFTFPVLDGGTTVPPGAGDGSVIGGDSGVSIPPSVVDSGTPVGMDSGTPVGMDGGKPVGTDGGKGDGGVVPEAGSADAGSDTGGPVVAPAVVSGCGTSKLFASNNEDTGAFGPWPVGVKTLKVPIGTGTLTTEVWYPAKLGSDQAKSKQTYDLRDWLPTGAVKIPESANKLAVCDCYRDLPLDTDHGPYPAVLYIHGLGSMRVASLSTMALWASRGFIVVAADHPGDMLTDFLALAGIFSSCSSDNQDNGDMAAEAKAVLAAMTSKTAGFDFVGQAMDLTRLAIGGHSQGGGTVAGMADTPNVKVVLTLAPLGGGALNAPVDSMLQVTGTIDSVTGYSTDAYTSDRSKIKRHVGILNGGHIDVTDLCKLKNPQGKTSIQVASDEGVCGAAILSTLAQCGGDAIATDMAPLIVNYATTAALEETLHCKNRDAAWNALKTKFSQGVSEFLHTP